MWLLNSGYFPNAETFWFLVVTEHVCLPLHSYWPMRQTIIVMSKKESLVVSVRVGSLPVLKCGGRFFFGPFPLYFHLIIVQITHFWSLSDLTNFSVVSIIFTPARLHTCLPLFLSIIDDGTSRLHNKYRDICSSFSALRMWKDIAILESSTSIFFTCWKCS